MHIVSQLRGFVPLQVGVAQKTRIEVIGVSRKRVTAVGVTCPSKVVPAIHVEILGCLGGC